MLGRVNAQGFENKHFEMRLIKLLMGRIARRGLRAQKTAQRSQVCFVEGLQESINFLDEAEKAENLEANTTSQPIKQRLQKICRYTRK